MNRGTLTLIVKWSSNIFSSILSSGVFFISPAFRTRMSNCPKAFTVSSINVLPPATEDTSAWIATALPLPSSLIFSTSSLAALSLPL